MLFYKMSGANEKMPSGMSSEISPRNIIEGSRKITLNSKYFNEVTINPGINIDDIMDKKKATCPSNEANDIRSANRKADEMGRLTVEKLSNYLSGKLILGGGKKKKGGDWTLFLPLAILLAKDTNKAIQAMSNLGIDYIYSWFDVMNKLTGCSKYIYDKAMYDIFPSLIYMYHDLNMEEVAPFIMNNGLIYFNYVIQKLSDVETTITNAIVKRKAEVLQRQYQEMKSRFVKGNEENVATNDRIKERLDYAGILKTKIDSQKRENQTIEDEEQELAKVEKLITELEKEKLENTQATINAVLQAKQYQMAEKILQTETIELGQMLLEDPIFQQANQNIEHHYARENKKVTKSSRKDSSIGSKDKLKNPKTIRGRPVGNKKLPENSGGGKRNTKKHYNKKKKTKKHAKKLHRKTKRG